MDREFRLSSNVLVVFNEYSGIELYDENDEELTVLSPADLGIIYGAYRNMIENKIPEKIEEDL